MGMDPLLPDENYEVTIVLEGPVKTSGFRNFRQKIYDLLDQCATVDDGTGTGKKLKVRESRGGVRKST